MNILFAWEWGAGVSHLVRFWPLADRLREQGHRVVLALRDLTHVGQCYSLKTVPLYQSPTLTGFVSAKRDFPQTFADLAWNLGYDSVERIAAQVQAYRRIMVNESIETVVSDFGLSASIAARSLGLRRIRIGTGFECPPLTAPLTNLLYAEPSPPSLPADDSLGSPEKAVLENINHAMRIIGGGEFHAFRQAIGDAGKTLLASVEELDPYAGSPEREYLGTWDVSNGRAPRWPDLDGHKVIAYLKPFPALPAILRQLVDLGCNVALVSDGIPATLLQSLGPRVVLQDGHVDLQAAARQCDFAIANCNHGMSIRMLSLGVPMIGFPSFFEQRIHAGCLRAHRLAIAMSPSAPERFDEAVRRATSPAAKHAVGRFSDKYSATLRNSLHHTWITLDAMINE
ncbi:glycosyltransferase [Stieleria neptunia]|nr:glycosyltransferase family 1 protein [Stieleria neptunia]